MQGIKDIAMQEEKDRYMYIHVHVIELNVAILAALSNLHTYKRVHSKYQKCIIITCMWLSLHWVMYMYM